MRMVLEGSDFENVETLDRAIEHLKMLRASLEKKLAKDAPKAPVMEAPPLQMQVLELLAKSPTGQLSSYEVAEALGMSQPEYAARIRGTGKAASQAQDTLYLRSWGVDPDGKRMRVYSITAEGRQFLEMLR